MNVRLGNHNLTCGFEDDVPECQNTEKMEKTGKRHLEGRFEHSVDSIHC